VNRDPIGYEGGQWNLYEYVTSDPVAFSDPYGERKCHPVLEGGSRNSKPQRKPGKTVGSAVGSYVGAVRWSANNSGAILRSRVSGNAGGDPLRAFAWSKITVKCKCNCEKECKASFVVAGVGFGYSEVGDIEDEKGSDYFIANAGILGFASGKTIRAVGFAGWSQLNQKSYGDDGYGLTSRHIQSDGLFLSLTWTCKGSCP